MGGALEKHKVIEPRDKKQCSQINVVEISQRAEQPPHRSGLRGGPQIHDQVLWYDRNYLPLLSARPAIRKWFPAPWLKSKIRVTQIGSHAMYIQWQCLNH